ncbi:glutamyl-tRNA(Gln) amidotransferase subunit HER2 [Ascoidea rubescens DSM 1968]|uniref:Glutamyl-tRNA(Gln) amidotransferase subunit A, mitochondrial n=1 Tax=Ascoidea rubescens DSM 1968 TaxID=1344418 RepID=A0A1D2VG41_9ASCO|nr:amidase signature enzyme [Ascoidea rubescens DSM 1968]ODV60621.1 amidase signature enzyme [Ascoidea rubescens DSM 1968]
MSIPNNLKPILARIDRIKHSNSLYNSLISVRDENVLKERTTNYFQKNKIVPYLCSIKDNIVTTEEATTCGSKILENYVSPFQATVVSILEGSNKGSQKDSQNFTKSIVIGKSNLDQFGMGSGTTNSIFEPTTNPLYKNQAHITGGSSGGAASIVTDDVCDYSIGTDTGGSIRLPAHYCGIIGFKPSYGRISRWGVIAYAQSFDTVGILSKDIKIIEDIYEQLNQYDPKDPTSLSNNLRKRIEEITKKRDEKLSIGLIQETNVEGISEEVSRSFNEAIEALFNINHTIRPVSLPSIKNSLPVYYTLALAEASSNLARYDGVRYGFHSKSSEASHGSDSSQKKDEFGPFSETRSEGFGKEVQKRILLGTYNLSSDSFKNNYLKANMVRKSLINQFNSVFKVPNVLSSTEEESKEQLRENKANNNKIDVLMFPVSTSTAPTLEDFLRKDSESSLNSYIDDVLTVPASLAGLPTIVVPWKSAANQMPIGIQVVGQFGDDQQVLEMGQLLLAINASQAAASESN